MSFCSSPIPQTIPAPSPPPPTATQPVSWFSRAMLRSMFWRRGGERLSWEMVQAISALMMHLGDIVRMLTEALETGVFPAEYMSPAPPLAPEGARKPAVPASEGAMLRRGEKARPAQLAPFGAGCFEAMAGDAPSPPEPLAKRNCPNPKGMVRPTHSFFWAARPGRPGPRESKLEALAARS